MAALSIITINLNNAPGLRGTIESVQKQKFTDWELLIIDGGSTDESREVIEQFKSQINLFVSEKDKGCYDAMNKGIQRASGKYLMFLNSGDYLLSDESLFRSFEIIREKKADVYFGDIEIPGTNGNQVVHYNPFPDLAYWRTGNINHQAAFYRRSLFSELGNYNLRYKLAADQDFNIRAFLHGNIFFHIGFPIVFYDVNGQSSKNFDEYQKEMKEVYESLLPAEVRKIVTEHKFYQNLLRQRIMVMAARVNTLYHNLRPKFKKKSSRS